MSRPVAAVLALAATAGAVGLSTAACRQPEQPIVPSGPINPTNDGKGALAYERADVIDASIVADASPSLEASIGRLDAATVQP